MKKKCSMCHKYLILLDFYRDNSKSDGRVSTCKKCRKIYESKHYKENKQKYKDYSIKFRINNPERYKAYHRESRLRRLYGLTPLQYDDLFKKQNYQCAICGETKFNYRMAVDHDHKTGKIRGILCHFCNRALGLMKDDINLLNKSIKYLKQNV